MKHTKLVSVTAFAAVLGLVGSACSSGDDSGPETATTEAVVGGVANTATVARPDTTDATTTSALADPGTEQAEPVPSVGTAGSDETAPPTSGSAEPVPSVSSSGSAPQGTSETPGSTTTTTATASATTTTATTTTSATPPTTTTSTTTKTTTTTIPSADDLRVQVLNGSGISGAAGRLTARLEEAGWDMLPAGNAPRRYSASAVYYSHDVLEDQAAEIAVDTGVGGVVSLAMPSPAPFVVEGAGVYVVVLIGADDLAGSLRPPARASSLRPRQDNNIQLPLPPSTPRDRYVPGLAAANPYTEANENNPASAGQLADLASFLKEIGDCSKHQLGTPQPEKCQNRLPLSRLYQAVEDLLEDLGFTPQNVCGAPPGYSFTSLLQPTRELDPEWNYHTGAAIRTTDRLVELHGGPRINPEENLSFYIRQAVQTTHDALRLPELLDQTETPQLILCRAWLAPSGEIPEFANGAWYALLTPGIQPRESLMSQGAYHMKYISNNGNRAFVYVCHPTLGAQEIALMWREAGYRAESVGERNLAGCQAAFEQYDNSGIPFQEPTTTFTFGERVFAAADLQPFPRAGG